MKHLWAALLMAGIATVFAPNTAAAKVPPNIRVISRYFSLIDGTQIAIDVVLPRPLPTRAKLPAILKISRFGRASIDGTVGRDDMFWAEHGYARVLIDERGTGASSGTSRLGTETIDDLRQIAAWVAEQPWSNGRIGALGISVEGTAAELLASTGLAAVNAVAPQFSDYDYYTDLVRPGGILNSWLLTNLQKFSATADAGASAKKTDSDSTGAMLRAAIADHRENIDLTQIGHEAPFIDDIVAGANGSFEQLSAAAAERRLASSGRPQRVPMLVYVSWLDAGTAQGALRRFNDLSNAQTLIVGAWSHGGSYDADPFGSPLRSAPPGPAQQRADILHFFDAYLKSGKPPPQASRRIWYYTMGERRWHSTLRWPPPDMKHQDYYLGPSGSLGARPVANGEAHVRLVIADTGEKNRWHTQLGGNPVDYSGAVRNLDALCAFQTASFSTPLEITGQPILHLTLRIAVPHDPAIFAYLLARDPLGKTVYITEGQLRLINRKLSNGSPTRHTFRRRDAESVPSNRTFDALITLLPTSVVVAKDWSLRLVLAAGDSSTFVTAGPFDADIISTSSLQLPSKAPR